MLPNRVLLNSTVISTFHRLDMKNRFMDCDEMEHRAPTSLIHLGLSSQGKEGLMTLQREVGSPNPVSGPHPHQHLHARLRLWEGEQDWLFFSFCLPLSNTKVSH